METFFGKHRESLIIALIVCVALVANGISYAYLSSLAAHNPQAAAYPLVAGDSQKYELLAENLLAHHVFSFLPDLSPSDTWPPGYPLLIAASRLLTGSSIPVILFQSVLEAFALALIFRIGRRFLPLALAAIPPLAFGLDPMVIVSNSTIVTDGLFASLIVFIAYLAFFETRMRPLVRWGMVGLLIGCATLVRPIAEFLVLLIPAIEGGRVLFRRSGKWIELLLPIGACIICFLIVVMPWVIRNHRVFGIYEIDEVSSGNLLYFNARDFLAWKEMEQTRSVSPLYPARHLEAPEFAAVDEEIGAALASNAAPGEDPDRNDGIVAMRFILGDPLRYAYFHAVNMMPFFVTSSVGSYQHITDQERDNSDLSASTLNTIETALRELRDPGTRWSAFAILAPLSAEMAWWLLVSLLALIAVALEWRRFETILFTLLVLYFAALAGPVSTARFRMSAEPFLLLLAAIGAYAIFLRIRRGFS